ncbi:hypothetical protein [Brevibacillus brevis]|uniref:hypothetical protein n=1 Tax=Brevibacillus brevis TaxID=1393 RepID=UPI0007D8C560|nr:hypothetical protein [Brevibacillus brevis]
MQQRKIDSSMIVYFLQGINTLIDNKIDLKDDLLESLINEKRLISYIYGNYGNKFWEFHCLLKYEIDLCEKLSNTSHLIFEDNYRKLGISNIRLLALSSSLMEELK